MPSLPTVVYNDRRSSIQSSSARHADAVSGILALPYLPRLSRKRNATKQAYFAQHALACKQPNCFHEHRMRWNHQSISFSTDLDSSIPLCSCFDVLQTTRRQSSCATACPAVAGVALVSENAPLDMKQFVFLFGNDDFSVLTTASTPTQTSPSSPRGRPKNSPCLPTTSPTAFTSRASTSATSAARFVRTEFAYCGYRSDEKDRGTPTPELLCSSLRASTMSRQLSGVRPP